MFGESLVCVDLKTGVRKWHYQVVHHPIWNYELSRAVWMPAPQSGVPMSYQVEGKQYIVVVISGGAWPGEYPAFRLPE